MESTIVFTGGGSGGHVFPGLAIIEELRQRFDGRIVWIGSKRGIERQIVSAEGIEYVAVPAGKLRRYVDLKNIVDVFRVLAGIVVSVVVLLRLRPSRVFSKGGYVSVPPLVAARILGIPATTHESDVDPGLATRINARLVDEVLLAYREAADGLPVRCATRVVGNPVRRAIFDGRPETGRSILGIDSATPLLLFVGGSLGARQINQLVVALLPRLRPRYFVVHQCGREMDDADEAGYRRRSFIYDEYPHFLAAADLVICRAGANTLGELSARGVPAVLIPLATGVSRGDQVRNAEAYGASGGAVVLDSATVDADTLYHTIMRLFDDSDRLEDMARAARALGGGDAASRIARRILEGPAEKSKSRQE